MRVTVCEWPDAADDIESAWDALVRHVRAESSELVVLPEMPFGPWLPASRHFDGQRWSAAESSHREWERRLAEAHGAAIVATGPFTFGDERVSSAFIWEAATGLRSVHTSSCARNEQGAWEQVWYVPAPPEFTPAHVGDVLVGLLVGMELWDREQARCYGEEGVAMLITPRASPAGDHDRWLRMAADDAALAGAFSLSSNRGAGIFGGRGWIVSPEGRTLALTSPQQPFVTEEIRTIRAD